jgi:hypothetical protein
LSSKSGYNWRDFDVVLGKLGWIQVPNHSHGFLTYKNELFDDRIIIFKENNYNLDYFHKLLRQLKISPSLFIQLARDRENSV